MGLGSAGTRIDKVWRPGTSLAEFRRMRDQCRRQRQQGIDPIIAREQQRAAQVVAAAGSMTFDECRDGYKIDHEKTWSDAHRQDWLNMIKNHVTPVFGTTPVAIVDTPIVLKVIKPIWTTKHPTAQRLRGYIESVLDWATATGQQDRIRRGGKAVCARLSLRATMFTLLRTTARCPTKTSASWLPTCCGATILTRCVCC
jgi:hypothetical protein